MNRAQVLFDAYGYPISPQEISMRIAAFGGGYSDAVKYTISKSTVLFDDGDAFISCASRILSSFKMTRGGVFHDDLKGTLGKCWNAVGCDLIRINKAVRHSRSPRERYILELGEREREALIADIWLITKKLLPLTMSEGSYGLVGASKILFSVLPEIVLPVDNAEWKQVFKTVDLGDVLRNMVDEILAWEDSTGRQLNDLDDSGTLTTLPSVYNVMAMYARP